MYNQIKACANALPFSALIAAITCRSQLCLLDSLRLSLILCPGSYFLHFF